MSSVQPARRCITGRSTHFGPVDQARSTREGPDLQLDRRTRSTSSYHCSTAGPDCRDGQLYRRQGGRLSGQAGAPSWAAQRRGRNRRAQLEGGGRRPDYRRRGCSPSPPPCLAADRRTPASLLLPTPPQREFEKRADPNDRHAQALLDEMRQHIKKVGCCMAPWRPPSCTAECLRGRLPGLTPASASPHASAVAARGDA